MAAIPFASTLVISPPPLSAPSSLRRSFLRRVPPSNLAPTRCSSVPSSVEILSSTECSDGSIIFRFADAEDLKRGKELRESKDGEFGERMEGAVESSKLAGESEVLDGELGVESKDSDVEVGVSESDAGSEKTMGLVGSKMCLESGNFDWSEVLGRNDALTEKGTGLEVESEIDSLERDQRTGLKVESENGLLERDQGSLLEVEPESDSLERDQETEMDSIRVCEEHEQVKNSQVCVDEEEEVEESMGGDHKEHITSVETVDGSPENGEVSFELESRESAGSGQEIEGKGMPLDEISEEEKSSAVGVEQKGESSNDLLLTEEVSTLVEGDNFRVPVSEVSVEQLDDALVSMERLEDDGEASEVSLTAVANLDMDAESSSTPVEENAEEKDTAKTSDLVIQLLPSDMYKLQMRVYYFRLFDYVFLLRLLADSSLQQWIIAIVESNCLMVGSINKLKILVECRELKVSLY